MLVWLVFLHGSAEPPSTLITVAIVLTVFLLVRSLLRHRIVEWILVASQSKADKAKMAGVHKLSITPEGLHYSSEHCTDKTVWPGIQRIVVTDKHIFFFIMSGTGHAAPRRAFESEEAFRTFAETAQRFKKEAEEKARNDPLLGGGVGSLALPPEVSQKLRPGDRDKRVRVNEPTLPNDLD